ncbi:MAG: hypothetical protein U1F47_00630 [Hyphomicrobiales bacterium]
MSDAVLELVVYKVKNPQTAAKVRSRMRPHLAAYPGFIDWKPLSAIEDAATFVDLVTWVSIEAAREAGRKVISDPDCAPLMAEIAEVYAMGHFGGS